MEIQLAKTSEGIYPPELIRKIENPGLDNGINFPRKQENYLRKLCSAEINRDFPFRHYSVKRVSGQDYVTVYWTYKKD